MVEVSFPILFYNYCFGTLITGRLIEGGRFKEVQLEPTAFNERTCLFSPRQVPGLSWDSCTPVPSYQHFSTGKGKRKNNISLYAICYIK